MMKTLAIVFFALLTIQVSAQDLKSMTSKATETAAPSSSMIEKLAGDQVKKLTKKLNLSDAQQEQVTGLVVSQLKSEKFSKLLGSVGADKLMGSSSDASDKITGALMKDEDFNKELDAILTDEQKKKLDDSKKG